MVEMAHRPERALSSSTCPELLLRLSPRVSTAPGQRLLLLHLEQRGVASACPVVGGLHLVPGSGFVLGSVLSSPLVVAAPWPGFGKRRGEQGACRSAPMGIHGRRLQGQVS